MPHLAENPTAPPLFLVSVMAVMTMTAATMASCILVVIVLVVMVTRATTEASASTQSTDRVDDVVNRMGDRGGEVPRSPMERSLTGLELVVKRMFQMLRFLLGLM
jgi:hypothetical protein